MICRINGFVFPKIKKGTWKGALSAGRARGSLSVILKYFLRVVFVLEFFYFSPAVFSPLTKSSQKLTIALTEWKEWNTMEEMELRF